MRRTLSLALALAAAPFAAASAATVDQGQTITVTGHPIADYRNALAACLARHCPVNEDVDATLALAEALFLDGNYRDARIAIRQSIARNRDAARNFPEPVADLYRADGRVNRHLGMDTDALRSAHNVLDALHAGIPTEDHRHFTARLELSETDMLMGRSNAARRELETLIENARAAGRQDVVTIAQLRFEYYDWLVDRNNGARERLAMMARDTDPAHRMASIGARILLGRIYRWEGDVRRSDAMFAEIGRLGSGAHRSLIFSPNYRMTALDPPVGMQEELSISEAIAYGRTLKNTPENYEGKWIDVGFWILPDGHVSGMEVLRQGGNTDWAQPLLTSVRNRIYSQGADSTYRIERYTYTAPIVLTAGSHNRNHSWLGRVEYLDLTTEDAPPPPPPSAGPGSPAEPALYIR